MKEEDNLLQIFIQAREAIKNEDAIKLSDLSNKTIHTASIDQDPDNIAVAVIIYALSKVVQRKKYQGYPRWKVFHNSIISAIDLSLKSLKTKDEKGFKVGLTLLRKSINKLSGKLRDYIKEVFRKASINKASRLYEHGISMETTASLLGITMYDLADYAGGTGIGDVSANHTLDVKTRIKFAMDLFK